MANNVHKSKRQKEADAPVSELRERQDAATVLPGNAIDWAGLTLLLMQMQEHLGVLTSQDVGKPGKKAVDGLVKCAEQLLPVLLAEARQGGPRE